MFIAKKNQWHLFFGKTLVQKINEIFENKG
jgi:hypothetical protein